MKNLLFVDDEPEVLQLLQGQFQPMRHEWNMSFVASGRQALEFMAARPVDVLITDMVMPEMDSSQLLAEVVKLYPRTVRIVLSGRADRESVLNLIGPAHQYLTKPCNAGDLRNAIARAITLRDLLGNERLKQLAARIKALPSLPLLYNQLTEEFEKEDASLERIGEIISRDMAMTAKTLQLVNSAFFALPQPIDNPADAVMYLGLTTVRSLTLLQIFSQPAQPSTPGFSLDSLARHCWMTGMAARQVAESEKKDLKLSDQCFLAGLLHDVGQLILATGVPQEYGLVLQTARKENVPVAQAELEHFGTTHADVGAYLLALWGLPNPVIEAVALHHAPARCLDPGFSPVIAVHVADFFIHQQSRAGTEFPPPGLDLAHLARLGLDGRIEAWRTVTSARRE
jgi:HD-like signal output (HDOD) protein/CheY-like chemotaxis protein